MTKQQLTDDTTANVRTLATIYYTADILTPDGTDTNCYGDPCEAGQGYELAFGWIDLDRDSFTVQDEKTDVRPDTILSDDARFDDGYTLDELIVMDLEDRLGVLDSYDGGTAYAADAILNTKTGESVSSAGHVTRGKVHTFISSRFTLTTTCEKCGLLPLDGDDYNTVCNPTDRELAT